MGNFLSALSDNIKAKILSVRTKFKLWTDKNFIQVKLVNGVKSFFSSLLNIKPRDSKDYYTIFGWLVSRRLVIAITVAIGIFSIYYIFFINPPSIFIKSGTGIRTYDYDSISLRFASGDVRILGESDYLAYEGEVSKGRANGNGTLYSKDGAVVYQGQFENSRYNGEGVRYYTTGQVMYIGSFVDNEFEGTGKLYRDNGSLEYEGSFINNMKEGAGVLYDESGNRIYQGNFSMDKLIYSDFLGKTTGEVADIYTGDRTAYSNDTDFVVDMTQIEALYCGRGDSNNVDGSIKVESVYVLKDIFSYGGKDYTTIYELKKVLGAIEYEGNTYVTMSDATAIHILNQRGSAFYGDIEGTWTEAFDDAVTVEDYDVNYTIYLYTFVDNGIRYNFYCKDRSGTFSMYSLEQE